MVAWKGAMAAVLDPAPEQLDERIPSFAVREYSSGEYIDFMRVTNTVKLFITRMNPTRQLVTTPTQLGEVLRGRRKARGLSQAELAAKLDISQSRLSTLESDPAGLTVDRLLTLASVLGLEIVVQDRTTSERRKLEW